MKKTNMTFLIILISLFFSCNNETKTELKIQEKSTKKSFQDFSKKTYRGQGLYLKKTENIEDTAKMALEYDFDKNIHDRKVSWEYFDKIYKENLTITEKQHLSFIILSTKDLIGLYNNDKSNKILEKKLIFYTKLLIDSEYIGYCLLYFSLNALKNSNPELINEYKNKILNYSTRDEFHKKTLSDKDLESSEMAIYYKKVKENFSYLDKIKKDL